MFKSPTRCTDYDKDGFTEIGKLEGSNIECFYKFNNKEADGEYHFINETRCEEQARHSTPLYRYHEQTEHNIHSAMAVTTSRATQAQVHAYCREASIARATGHRRPYAYAPRPTTYGGVQYSYSIEKLLFMPSEVSHRS